MITFKRQPFELPDCGFNAVQRYGIGPVISYVLGIRVPFWFAIWLGKVLYPDGFRHYSPDPVELMRENLQRAGYVV